jgi:hypothetical protein
MSKRKDFPTVGAVLGELRENGEGYARGSVQGRWQ